MDLPLCSTDFAGSLIKIRVTNFLQSALKGPLSSEAPAAFAGIIYLVVRQKYFVGYMGQTSQRYKRPTSIDDVWIYNHLIFFIKSLSEHPGLFVWKTDPLFPAADVCRGHLQLPVAALLWQRLQGARGNHHQRCLGSAPHSVVQVDLKMLLLLCWTATAAPKL